MDTTVRFDAPCPAATLFGVVDDLSDYPRWLDLVHRAEELPDGEGAGPAWAVELRGRVGPLTRSKRLRMVRTELSEGEHARFERAELDGRTHAAWVLDARVEETGEGSRLTMGLHYGGGLWGPVFERLLSDEIRRSEARLLELVSRRP